MCMESTIPALERSIGNGLQLFGVLVIGFAFIHAVVRCVLQFGRGTENAFENLKIYLGKALQLALEFLVAADIIATVTDGTTREGLLMLGLLILVRTLLSWSITVEIEGRWPWQRAKK